ncbi:MAG: glycoside hydrolase family 172 protein [Bacteroidales bacterium]
MRTAYRPALVAIALMMFTIPGRADILKELAALSRIDRLPAYLENCEVWQVSSYDTTGGNDDGFSGNYSFIRKENGHLVIAELKGPGVIQRIWTPTPTTDTIEFYFDNEKVPRISLPFIDLFSGTHHPFLRPVVGNEVGGYYCYVPIPYQGACKVVFKGSRMQFFQIQYRKLTGSETVVSFPRQFSIAEEEALQRALATWSRIGGNIPGIFGEGVKVHEGSYLLSPGTVTRIYAHNRGGRIIGIELIPRSGLNPLFRDLILQAWWDEEEVPAINCPVADFFGYAFGRPSMQSMLLGVLGDIHYCYFPMPYGKRAVLDLVYLQSPDRGGGDIPCDVRILYSDETLTKGEGRFYAQWRREVDPEAGDPYTLLELTGRGHHVGTLLQAQGLNPGMTIFFEGDDVCIVDGEMRLHGTGSEDYFNGGWYALADRWDQAFSLPVHGCLDYSIPLARTGGYRLLISDKIPFEKSLSLTIEHGPEGNQVPVDYTSVAFYYCDTPPESNEIPGEELLAASSPPALMEYYLQLLPVQAFSGNATLAKEAITDASTGNRFDALTLEAGRNGFVKFELQVPEEGEYKLYLSYFKGPGAASFVVNQRQIPVCPLRDAQATETVLVSREYMGNLSVKQGTNTITVMLKGLPAGSDRGRFSLHRAYLERL